jgi:DNA-binding IscR family transcriptional regulator
VHRVDEERCDPATPCSIRPVWRLLQRRINEVLAGITLADLRHAEPEVYQIAGVGSGN